MPGNVTFKAVLGGDVCFVPLKSQLTLSGLQAEFALHFELLKQGKDHDEGCDANSMDRS